MVGGGRDLLRLVGGGRDGLFRDYLDDQPGIGEYVELVEV